MVGFGVLIPNFNIEEEANEVNSRTAIYMRESLERRVDGENMSIVIGM